MSLEVPLRKYSAAWCPELGSCFRVGRTNEDLKMRLTLAVWVILWALVQPFRHYKPI